MMEIRTIFAILMSCIYATLPLMLCLFSAVSIFRNQRGGLSGNTESRRCVESQSVYWKGNKDILFLRLLFAFVISFTVVLYIDGHCVDYLLGAYTKCEEVNSIVLNLTSISFTIAAGLVLLKKGYYLVFSIYDILEEYGFFFWLKGVVITCLCSCGLTVILLRWEQEQVNKMYLFILFELIVLLNAYFVIKVFHISFKVMFSKNANDLQLLDKLYRVYEIENLDFSQMEDGANWKKSYIEINLGKILENYGKNYTQAKIEKVQRIDYISTINEKKWYKKSVIVYEIVSISFYILGCLLLWREGAEIGVWFKVLSLILFLVEVLLPILRVECIRKAILYIFWGAEGFCIQEREQYKTKPRFISNLPYQLLRKKYIRYMRSFNSLTAFVKIAVEKTQDKKIIENIINEYLVDKYKTSNHAVELLPLFIIGYIMYENDIKMESIRELYGRLGLEDDKQIFDFQTMLCSHIYYTEKTRKIGYMEGNKGSYIEWLSFDKEEGAFDGQL